MRVRGSKWKITLGAVLFTAVAVVVIVVPIVEVKKRDAKQHDSSKTYAGYPAIPDDMSTPTQQRIAYLGPDSMSVAWNTYKEQSKPCVRYGPTKDNLKVACGAASKTYPTSRTYFNVVNLTGLTPATDYVYEIVSSNSTFQQFQSPRAAGDKTAFNMSVVVDLGVYGKFGYTEDKSKRTTVEQTPMIQPELSHSTIGRLADKFDDYELVIHPGDFAYADRWDITVKDQGQGKDAFEAILEMFYGQLAPIAGAKSYMVSPGNHEAVCKEDELKICPQGQRNFTDFMTRFGDTMPHAFPSTSNNSDAKTNAEKAKELANPPFWYSFEHGLAHITMIDTETDFPNAPGGPGTNLDGGPFGTKNQQLDFLKADLASVDRSQTPWLIVAGHRPWYTVTPSADSSRTCKPCREAFEDLFYTYGVDVGVFGHVHNSQRFVPIYKDKPDPAGMQNPKAPMYIISGGSGNIEPLAGIKHNTTGNAFAYNEDYSFATLHFKDRNQLGIDFVNSRTGEVLDSSMLYKEHNESFVNQGS